MRKDRLIPSKMINETEPGAIGDDSPWNTEEEIFPGLTCGEAARFMSAFTSAFRMLSWADKTKGRKEVLDQVIGMLLLHKHAVYNKPLKGITPQMADKDTELGFAAIGLSAIYATSDVDTRAMLELTMTAMRVSSEVLDKFPETAENTHLKFVVRKAKNGMIEFGATVQTIEESQESQDKSGLSKLIEDLKDEEQRPEDN